MSLVLLEKIIDNFFAVMPRSKPSLDPAHPVRLIAHRGAHNHAQGIIENTLPAFRLAAKAGCWGIELDVHATADHILVVNHDPTLKRLWGLDLRIAHLTFADLRAQVPEIPMLAEVVAEFGGRVHLFIELKKPFTSEMALIQILQGLQAVTDYHLLTLEASVFADLSHIPKSAMLLVASHNNMTAFCDLSLDNHYGGVLGHYLLLTTKLAKRLKANGQEVGVGLVDSKYSMYRELRKGIYWLFTNNVAVVSNNLNAL
ncbi:MAG: glycerophosphodiester phosphodiesterase family protein [Legionella sp.]|uniref:glycerophosphodiester phosphodiesterase n=1 Tax=Legionella sp. TaxID=459 RepID=UPI0039E5B062